MTTLTILRFDVGGLACAFDVRDVVEVLRIVEITRLPRASTPLAGIIDMRGVVLPVIDLRLALGEEVGPFAAATRIIVTHGVPGYERPLGFIVDQVHDVDTAQPEAPGMAGADLPVRALPHVKGFIKGPERLLMVLDLTRLLEARLTRDLQVAALAGRPGGQHAA